jgi:hypothetical protein
VNFTYEIGGRKFKQKPLVLGQVKQLIALLKGLVLPYDLSIPSLIMALGNELTPALSIVLIEDGTLLKNKDMEELGDFLEGEIDIETTVKVISDFFDCNPIASMSEALIGLTTKIKATMTQASTLTESVSSSPKETLPSEMISSGDTPSESVVPT